MKLSDRLFSETQYLWIEASSKEFLKLMACGTLDKELYSNYMLQDYLYLLDYIDILKDVQKMSSDHDITDFLETIIKATTDETGRVLITCEITNTRAGSPITFDDTTIIICVSVVMILAVCYLAIKIKKTPTK